MINGEEIWQSLVIHSDPCQAGGLNKRTVNPAKHLSKTVGEPSAQVSCLY